MSIYIHIHVFLLVYVYVLTETHVSPYNHSYTLQTVSETRFKLIHLATDHHIYANVQEKRHKNTYRLLQVPKHAAVIRVVHLTLRNS